MTTPHHPRHGLTVRFARPSEIIIGGQADLALTRSGQIELRIDPHAGADPALLDPLAEAGEQAFHDLLPLLEPGRPPIIRCYVERHMPGNKLVHVEVDPRQTDVHIAHGLARRLTAHQIAGLSTHLMRRVTPPRSRDG
ncbi:hypothetical protein ACFWYW_48490 [Nonomuraea sp. NPDC059023]|uniref:hypothetical protein n=1 Tax=unclassified Nonomuraea TaxID=2593643 RepID=UPI003699B20C